MKKILLFVLLQTFILCNQLLAQCTAPTNASTTVTNITCASNGVITVTNVTGSNAGSFQYALYNQTNDTLIKPYQDTTAFTNLQNKTYTLRVRGFCQGIGYSNEYTKAVTVGGTYTTPNISIALNREEQCNNGRITASSTGGTNPKTYALVPSQNASEPVSNYIRVPQSSSMFDSLAAGVYYVRVYDACGSFNTASITVPKFTQTNPFPNGGFRFNYTACNTLTATIILNNLPNYIANTGDTLRKLWIVWPDNTVDTLTKPGGYGTNFMTTAVPLEKLGTVNPVGRFPNNIGGTWPKSFTAYYLDPCGNLFSFTHQMQKPVISFSFSKSNGSQNNTCDSAVYLITANGTNLYSVNMNNQAYYSIDNGTTWSANPFTGNTSPEIKLAVGSSATVKVAFCGDTLTLNPTTIAGPGNVNINIYEDARYACFGSTGIEYYATGGTAPIIVEMLSGPTGQNWIVDTIKQIHTSGVIPLQFGPSSKNMIPGTYTLKFTDACGKIINKTITINHPKTQYDLTYKFACGSNNLIISVKNDTFYNGYSANYPSFINYMGAGVTKAVIRDANMVKVNNVIYASSGTSGQRTITIPESLINSLANGTYYIQVYQSATDTACTSVFKSWVKTNGLISLNNSVSIAGCSPSGLTGTVVGNATGGSGGFSYSLYTDSVSNNTLVAGPQSSNIFNNLNQNKVYILTVVDTCGRGTNTSLNFSSGNLLNTTINKSLMPCPGDNVVMSASNVQGITYQWHKDSVAIQGATNSSYALSNLTVADNGLYEAQVTAGTCITNYALIDLDINDCGEPLPLSIYNFKGLHLKEANQLSFNANNNEAVINYQLQKSIDGINWETIQTFAPTNAKNMQFAFNDYAIDQYASYYYRVKQFETDNNTAFSAVLNLSGKTNNTQYKIYPNPSNGHFKIQDIAIGSQIDIIDVLGSTVLSATITNKDDAIDVQSLANGNYILRINTASNHSIHKLIIAK